MKNSSKRSDFLRFYLYLCHVIDDFACLEYMKPLIVVYSLLMILFCCSCGSDHPARRVTEENAYEGVSNYCHQMYGYKDGGESTAT